MLGLGMANKVVGLIDPYTTSPDNVILYYNFDQYLFTEKEDPTQGVGLFGRFGWARSDVNAVNYFYSMGVGGKGVIPTRDKDTFGVGYYYVDTSNDLPQIVNKEAGVEMFYNIEITPWMHITPDIQVISDPGGTRALHETAFVYGIRMQLNL
jgi:porin